MAFREKAAHQSGVKINYQERVESVTREGAGGVLPTAFLKAMGIHVETKHGTA